MVRLPRSLASHEMGYVCACLSQRQSIALCTFPFPKSEIIEVFPQQPAWLPVSVTRGETDQGRRAAATHLQHRRQDVSGHCQVIQCNDACRQWVLQLRDCRMIALWRRQICSAYQLFDRCATPVEESTMRHKFRDGLANWGAGTVRDLQLFLLRAYCRRRTCVHAFETRLFQTISPSIVRLTESRKRR
jgi:hypothetical protein